VHRNLDTGALFKRVQQVLPMNFLVIASLASFLFGMIVIRVAGLQYEAIGGLLGVVWFWWSFVWLMRNKPREVETIKKELERMYRRIKP